MGERVDPLDFTQLSVNCSPRELRAMRVAAGSDRGLGMPRAMWLLSLRSGIVLLVCLAALFLLEGTRGRIGVALVAAALLALWLLALGWWSRQARRLALGRARLRRFAQANGFHYEPRRLPFPAALDPDLVYRGVGGEETIGDRLDGVRGRPFLVYALRFVTTVGVRPSGRNRLVHLRGVLSFELPAELPDCWIDSETRGMVGGLLRALERYPRTLELEGQFRSQFRVRHAEHVSPTELLYVLQPDVMAVLLDFGRGIQLQLSGRKVYLIGRFSLPDGARTLPENLFALYDALAPKLEKLALQRSANPGPTGSAGPTGSRAPGRAAGPGNPATSGGAPR